MRLYVDGWSDAGGSSVMTAVSALDLGLEHGDQIFGELDVPNLSLRRPVFTYERQVAFQRPHPDDRHGSRKPNPPDWIKLVVRDEREKAELGEKGRKYEEQRYCFFCEHLILRAPCECKRCRQAWYCDVTCLELDESHHVFPCVAAVAAGARRATRLRNATRRVGVGVREDCAICMTAPMVAPVELPCGHAYCGGCLDEQRRKGVTQRCPLCREDLPPAMDVLSQLAMVSVAAARGWSGSSPLRYDFERLRTASDCLSTFCYS